ncbi:MAG: GHKL domain-containing protein [Candidatus Aminicenantes bacterium]|nr:GHKL domain-containing protein [Candidatus Aminicenantes bacterium]
MSRSFWFFLLRITGFALVLLLLFGTIFAYRKDLIFNYLGVKEGLSQGTVNCILKDHNGFMWFGTVDGLNRYDGLSFTIYHYQVDNPQSLSDNNISCLFEDKDGYLWVGTNNGLNRMDTGLSRFLQYRHNSDNPKTIISDSIRSICQDQQGNFWIGTDEGLDYLVSKTEQFIHYHPDPQDPGSIAGRSINFVLADRDGRIWIGLRDKGVDCYNPETGRFYHYRHEPKNDRTLASDMSTYACLAPDGTIWISHESFQISRLFPKTGLVQRYGLGEDARMINCICTDHNGNIWISSGNGLYFLNVSTGELINIRSNPRHTATLNTNGLFFIYVDETDILWVGTGYHGVNKANLKAKRFVNYTHDPSNPDTLGFSLVRGIYENQSGVLYIGGSGFDRLDRKTGTWRHFSNEKENPIARIGSEIFSICPNSEDERDILWISTNGDGIFVFDQVNQVIRPYSIPGLKSEVVYGLYKDNEDFLWIGTDEDLYRYDQKKKKIHNFDLKEIAGLKGTLSTASGIYWMIHDRDGILWVGFRGIGLFTFDSRKNRWRYFSHDPENPLSLSSNQVTTILETEAGEIWIGSYGGGFNRFNRDNGTFEHYTTRKGLPNDVVYGILEDNQGQLWISCNLGITCFNPFTNVFRNFTDKDGLTGNEFNTQSFFKSPRTGELFFGGTNGFNAFFPTEITNDPHPPIVILEDFKIFNQSIIPGPDSVIKKPINEIDSLSLSYRDSMLSFEFNGLHYVSPAKNRFAYILEGVDPQWNYTDAQHRHVTYTNISPGHYTFHVKAANSDGVWNETGKILKIHIAPPFWKTWWFKGISVVLVIFLIFFVYKVRTHTIRERNRRLEKMVEKRTRQLKTANGELKDFAYIVSHDLKAPLRAISQLSTWIAMDYNSVIDQKGKEKISLLIGRTKRMSNLIDGILQYSRAGRVKGEEKKVDLGEIVENVLDSLAPPDHIHVSIKTALPVVMVDRVKISQVFQNLISNAIKYIDKPAGKIKISCEDKGRFWKISISDNGPGIEKKYHKKIFQIFQTLESRDTQESTGVGLSVVKKIIDLHGGDIWVESEIGKGSTFCFTLKKMEQNNTQHQPVSGMA